MEEQNIKEHSGSSEASWIDKIKPKYARFLTKKNQRIWYVLTLVASIASIADVFLELFSPPVSIAVYVCAALCFFSSCALWIRTLQILINAVLSSFTERNQLLLVFIKDYRLRTIVMSLPGLGMNLIFAIFNGVVGIVTRSAWSGSLSAYYTLLSMMRFISVMYAKSIYIDKMEMTNEERELRVYRNCGLMLSAMSIALAVAVTILVAGQGGKAYPGVLVFAVAAFTFYKVIMSAVNIAKARKEKSLLLITLRYIGHSEALVSLLSLQTALFAAFGQDKETMIPVMNAITGSAVCLSAFVLGIHMVLDAGKRIKELNIKNAGRE